MLSLHELSFDYPEKNLLSKCSFTVESGQILHLQGANGVGKTTLLRLLAGILQPTEGDIFYNQQSIYHDLSGYQRHLAYVGHRAGFHPLLSIKENCEFSIHFKKPDFSEYLIHFALQKVVDLPCGQLSAGQLRRAAFLRLLMSPASIWLLDEPYVALDQASLEVLTHCMRRHVIQGGLIVLTSHQALANALGLVKEYVLS